LALAHAQDFSGPDLLPLPQQPPLLAGAASEDAPLTVPVKVARRTFAFREEGAPPQQDGFAIGSIPPTLIE
jgi:hypothetical protein